MIEYKCEECGKLFEVEEVVAYQFEIGTYNILCEECSK